jgi:hypothetical protein
MAMETTTERGNAAISSLTSLLRGEISAVETYRQALEKITDPTIRATLQENLDSHQSRCDLLRSRLVQLGGKVVEGSGPWGAFAKLVEGGAKLFGEKAAIAALEEGEDHGLRDYRDEINKLGTDVRSFVEIQLLPAQERTHRAMSSLKKTIH